jgi:short-subunit dehydrogenase
MRIVVVSATSEIAKSGIRVWAQQSACEFVLVGRNPLELKTLAKDFSAKFPSSNFSISVTDFQEPTEITKAMAGLSSPIDIILIAQGSATNQKKVKQDLAYLKEELLLNAVSVAMFAEVSANILEGQGTGALAIIGSVAGDRGRAYNYSYGSAKALVEKTTQGLQQRLAKTKVSVSLIKPGPTATPMTREHKGNFASPDDVAQVMVAGIGKAKRTIYAPKRWRLIMFVVRNIPFSLFKRFRF